TGPPTGKPRTSNSGVGRDVAVRECRGVAIQGRRRWWRRWRRRVALQDVLRDIALPERHIPVGVADAFVPADRVRHMIAGLHRGIAGAPVTRARRVIVGAARPGIGGRRTDYPGDAAPQQRT